MQIQSSIISRPTSKRSDTLTSLAAQRDGPIYCKLITGLHFDESILAVHLDADANKVVLRTYCESVKCKVHPIPIATHSPQRLSFS